MSYQVLARKWRPGSFAEMAGQEHVLRALINALDQQRLHQAYLFTGTRGVGKTTIARILAKALNCERGVSSTPCGECASCKEIDTGRFIDLIEVDAASRTKVEDTRELLDNVQYTPSRGRYKVYLIDEVHMLSTHSFNALLKTLEEPPPHVKFLLATTDPQKLPATILSRCLQFNLKRMSEELIAGRLVEIMKSEQIEHDKPSVHYLAQAADGSMRDGLSLLDQAIAYGHGKLQAEEVAAMLGFVSREPIYEIVAALLNQDATALLQAVAKLEEMSADYFVALDDLISLLQQLALAQWAPQVLDEEHHAPEQLREFSEAFSAEDLQLFYQIALLGKRDLSYSPNARRGLEMILLRMLAFKPAGVETDSPGQSTTGSLPRRAKSSQAQPVDNRPAHLQQSESANNPGQKAVVEQNPIPSPAAPVMQSVPEQNINTVAESVNAAPAENTPQTEWQKIYQSLDLKAMVAELAANCDIREWQGDTLILSLDEKHEQLNTPAFTERLAESVSGSLGKKVIIKIEVGEVKNETPAATVARQALEIQEAAVQSIEQDQIVQVMKEKFGARVLEDTIRPHK
jgi:DNA polymerase-3 subunit gamma/tau